jgi:hypothetical protein
VNILDVLGGAGAGIMIFELGQWLPRPPSLRRRRAPAAPKPVCGCDHHYSLHDPETARCHGTVKSTSAYNHIGVWVGHKDLPCTCRRYSGPVPLPEYFAPEIS